VPHLTHFQAQAAQIVGKMEAVSIRVNENIVHPAMQQEGGEHFAADAAHSDYLLIQCTKRLWPDEKKELKRLGVTVLRFVAGNTYFCHFLSTDLEPVRTISFVLYANVYHPDLVIAPQLRVMVGEEEEEEEEMKEKKRYSVYIIPHADRRNDLGALKERMLEHTGTDPSKITMFRDYMLAQLTMSEIESIAGFDEVQSIAPVTMTKLFNDEARKALGLDGSSFSINVGAYNSATDLAVGEKIAITDSGIDEKHEAFGGVGKGRVELGMSWRGDSTHNDVASHGTHVTASAIGLGTHTGTALGATAYISTIFENDGKIVELLSLEHVLTNPYDAGARVASNSWGGEMFFNPKTDMYDQLGYDLDAQTVDKLVHEKGDFVILYAAGNQGKEKTNDTNPKLSQIGSIPSARNIITVGACESRRPMVRGKAGQYQYQKNSRFGQIKNMADFSNRGPTKPGTVGGPGRIKPDVVAPGAVILSARSAQLEFWPSFGTKNPDYNGVSDDSKYIWSQGTSMAAPLVAGCCAAIRSALRKKHARLKFVPAALVKAVLVNGTDDMSRSRGSTVRKAPNPSQGFGRVNLSKSLLCLQDDIGAVLPSADDKPLQFGTDFKGDGKFPREADPIVFILDEKSLNKAAKKAGLPLKFVLTITMCYTDTADTGGTSDVQSLLAMRVRAKGNKIRYANTGTDVPDFTNNVQKLIWEDIPIGKVSIEVICHDIPHDFDQNYALAWYVSYVDASNNPQYIFWDQRVSSAAAIAATTAISSAVLEESKSKEFKANSQ
jgi:serine protease AprX